MSIVGREGGDGGVMVGSWDGVGRWWRWGRGWSFGSQIIKLDIESGLAHECGTGSRMFLR